MRHILMRSEFIALAILIFLEVRCQLPNNNLPGFDYRIFKESPCWQIAKAINDDDSLRISYLAQVQKMNVNCFDPEYGTSLLDLAVINNKSKAFCALLQVGVDVNARSPRNSSTSLYQLCTYSDVVPNTSFYIKTLINHGADVNASVPDSLEGRPIQTACLEQLVRSTRDTSSIGFLIDHGARLDVYPKNGLQSLIGGASFNRDLRPLRYLLIERKLDIPKYISIRDRGSVNQEFLTLRKVLNERDVSSYPDQQKVKEEILAFLTQYGE